MRGVGTGPQVWKRPQFCRMPDTWLHWLQPPSSCVRPREWRRCPHEVLLIHSTQLRALRSAFALGSVLELTPRVLFSSGSQCPKALTEAPWLLLAKGRLPGSYMFNAGAQGTGWSGHWVWAPPARGEHVNPGSAQAAQGGGDPRPAPGTHPYSEARRSWKGVWEGTCKQCKGSRRPRRRASGGPSSRKGNGDRQPARGPSDCQCLQGLKRHQDQLVRGTRRQILA